MAWIYEHPKIYDFLDSFISFGLSNKAREYVINEIIKSLSSSYNLNSSYKKKNIRIEKRILEVGIGTAKSFRYLNSNQKSNQKSYYKPDLYSLDFFGVDINERMLKIAKKRKAKISLAHAYTLPFKDNFFDFVLFLFSIPKDPKKAIKEALRVGENIVILEYKPLPKLFELFGKKVFNNPNLKLKHVLKEINFIKYHNKKFENLFDIYFLSKRE